MILTGLTDSLATQAALPNECPHCHTASRIAHGLCLVCLLRSGEEEADDISRQDDFEAALDAVAIADTHWRLGNYEILEEIGRGGMGVIYRARQRHSRRIVALKRVLSYHADSRETLARFRREAEAAASLDHPNILPIYEVGESEEGVPYFSMKYASGGSLQEVGPALRGDPREVVRLLAKVTRAVQYAHRQGILHRDLKPGNVLLDGRGEPMVSDFGLAKWLDTTSNLTRTLTIFGTPGYIAPEQAEGPAASLKPSSDIYSLGAILFDLLSGRPPFLGEHALAVIRQASEKPAPKLRSLVKGVDKDLETICARCLEREPAARYRSAGELAEDLERWLEGRPIVARPVLPPVKLWRWSKRNPIVALSIAASALATLFAIGWEVKSGRLSREVQRDELAARSIAVLPFLDLDALHSDDGFARSLASALGSKFTELGVARVLSTKAGVASFPGAGKPDDLRQIGAATGVRTAITGTLRRAGKKQRISLRLSDVNSARPLFTRTMEVDASAGAASEVARECTQEIFSILSGIQPPSSPDDPAVTNSSAHEFLRAGDELLSRGTIADIDRSIGCYRRAIELQPRSGIARAAFVIAAVNRAALGSPDPELLGRAEQYGREAVALNDTIESSHRALESLFFFQGKFIEARQEALREIEAGGFLYGAVGLSLIDKTCGRPDLALGWSKICSHWSSRPADCECISGDCWAQLVDDIKADAYYRRVSDLYPETPEGWIGLCRLKLLQGDFAAARKIYQESVARYPDYRFAKEMAAQVEFFSRNFTDAEQRYTGLDKEDPNGGGSFYGGMSYQSAIGRSMQAADDKAGEEVLQRCLATEKAALRLAANHPKTLYCLAAIESSLGEVESSLTHLKSAFTNGWLDYRSLALDPRFDRVRQDTRYQQVSEAMATRVASLRRSKSAESQ